MEAGREASRTAVDGDGSVKPMFTDAQMRKLRVAVIVMGVVLLLGFAVVIGRIVYLLNRGSASTAERTAPAASPSAVAAMALSSLTLPAGAVVRSLAVSGNQLAVHFDGPAGGGILIVDVASGRTVRRIDIVTER